MGRENPPAPGRRPEGSGSGRVRRRTLVDHPGGSPAPGPSRPAACLTAAAAERLIPVTVTLCPRCGQVAAGGPMQIKGGGPRAKPCAFAHPAWRGRGQARCVRAHGSVPGSPRTLACMRRPRRRSVMTSQTSIARSRTASLPRPRRNGSSPSRSTARPAPPAGSRPARTQRSRAPVRRRRGRRPRRGTDESPEPGLSRTPEDRPAGIAVSVIRTPHSDRKSSHCGTSTRDRKRTHYDESAGRIRGAPEVH